MSNGAASTLLSKRGQQHLRQLHGGLALTARTLDRALASFLAAVQACDRNTQQEFLSAYCEEVAAHHKAIRQIMLFVNHRFDAAPEPSTTESE